MVFRKPGNVELRLVRQPHHGFHLPENFCVTAIPVSVGTQGKQAEFHTGSHIAWDREFLLFGSDPATELDKEVRIFQVRHLVIHDSSRADSQDQGKRVQPVATLP